MILRTEQDVALAQDCHEPAFCSTCHEPVDLDSLAELYEDAWVTECCGVPAYVKDRAVQLGDPTLAELHGPAWQSFVAVPRVLLAATWKLPDGHPHHGRKASASTKLLAIELLGWLNMQRRSVIESVFPDEETLAERSGISKRSVRRSLAELEAMGLLKRHRRHRANGAKASSFLDLEPLREALNLAANLAPRPPDDLAANLDGRNANVQQTTEMGSPSGQIGHDLAAKLAGDLAANLAPEVERAVEVERVDLDQPASLRDVGGQDLDEVMPWEDPPAEPEPEPEPSAEEEAALKLMADATLLSEQRGITILAAHKVLTRKQESQS